MEFIGVGGVFGLWVGGLAIGFLFSFLPPMALLFEATLTSPGKTGVVLDWVTAESIIREIKTSW